MINDINHFLESFKKSSYEHERTAEGFSDIPFLYRRLFLSNDIIQCISLPFRFKLNCTDPSNFFFLSFWSLDRDTSILFLNIVPKHPYQIHFLMSLLCILLLDALYFRYPSFSFKWVLIKLFYVFLFPCSSNYFYRKTFDIVVIIILNVVAFWFYIFYNLNPILLCYHYISL